jgi:hypothetical protein
MWRGIKHITKFYVFPSEYCYLHDICIVLYHQYLFCEHPVHGLQHGYAISKKQILKKNKVNNKRDLFFDVRVH